MVESWVMGIEKGDTFTNVQVQRFARALDRAESSRVELTQLSQAWLSSWAES